jgi:hypothetical protein
MVEAKRMRNNHQLRREEHSAPARSKITSAREGMTSAQKGMSSALEQGWRFAYAGIVFSKRDEADEPIFDWRVGCK